MSTIKHPALKPLKKIYPDMRLLATEFRGNTTVVVTSEDLYSCLEALKNMGYDFLSDIAGVDYKGYPTNKAANAPTDRFGVIYNIYGTGHLNTEDMPRLFVKVLLSPSLPTDGIESDPALELPSVCTLWAGAEWMEREVYDMFGITFSNHPDLRRILLWRDYPGHPLRKDYPVKGHGERELFEIIGREDV